MHSRASHVKKNDDAAFKKMKRAGVRNYVALSGSSLLPFWIGNVVSKEPCLLSLSLNLFSVSLLAVIQAISTAYFYGSLKKLGGPCDFGGLIFPRLPTPAECLRMTYRIRAFCLIPVQLYLLLLCWNVKVYSVSMKLILLATVNFRLVVLDP